MPMFSTAAVPPRDQFEAWRHVITRQFLPLRPEPVTDARFWGAVRGGTLDSLALAHVRAGGQVVHRSSREIAQSSPDSLFVNIQVEGTSGLACGADTRRLAQGDLFFVDGRRPFRLHCEAPMHHVCVAIPMKLLRAGLLRPELAAGATVQRDTGISALLSDYLISVGREYESFDPTAAQSAARHVIELVTHVLNERNAGTQPPRVAVRAALYARACQLIEQELADPLLSPARLAARLRVSVRFLHALFREQGSTLMRVVYEKRIRRAAAMLSDTAHAHRSITEIALGCGFSDLTHFGRVFAQAFGETPRALRARLH